MALCAALVRLSSPGPILFSQGRVGQNERMFELLKFRTMAAGWAGPRITASGDPRITAVGRWLRRNKLDELPQLINVLKGEMSFVGPRPEVPEYVATYSPDQRRVFQWKPGITSPASLTYVEEESALANREDLEDCYTHVVLPHKLEIDLRYCAEASFAKDLQILFATLRRLLPGRGRSSAEANPRSGVSSMSNAGKDAATVNRY
jgi:lipopolysaccharide/colanic/teichoic acid biosynthesis glycosyltransferase